MSIKLCPKCEAVERPCCEVCTFNVEELTRLENQVAQLERERQALQIDNNEMTVKLAQFRADGQRAVESLAKAYKEREDFRSALLALARVTGKIAEEIT